MRRSRTPYTNELSQIVRFTIFSLVLAAIVVAALAYAVPFDVPQRAIYDEAQGTAFLIGRNGFESEISEIESLAIQEKGGLRLEPENSGRVEILEGSGAFAYLTGPTTWRLAVAERHGTAVEQILNSEDLTYQLVIDQTEGTVVYDFSQSDPPLEDINLILRLPEGEYEPEFPCFQASAPAPDAALAVVEIPCYGEAEIEPRALPTLSSAP
jgi:hypothetical protein